MSLAAEGTMLVETVRAFVDRDVKPTVRDVEHAGDYPEAWIEQMKRIGIFQRAIAAGQPVGMCHAAWQPTPLSVGSWARITLWA